MGCFRSPQKQFALPVGSANKVLTIRCASEAASDPPATISGRHYAPSALVVVVMMMMPVMPVMVMMPIVMMPMMMMPMVGEIPARRGSARRIQPANAKQDSKQ